MILKDIIFTKKDTKGASSFETTLKLDQNFAMVLRHWRVALIQQVLLLLKIPQFLTDICIAWQFEVVFDVFEVELDKGATLDTVFMGG